MGPIRIDLRISFLLILTTLLSGFNSHSQYTDVINSNRPGLSVSAYAVGTGVIQGEFGLGYEQRDHKLLNYESDRIGADIALRYGLLFETLEIYWEGSFNSEDIIYNDLLLKETRADFTRNQVGLKFLIFDPFKNPENNKPNLYSWRKNNVFQLKNLIPAISIYGGANFVVGDNPFYRDLPLVSPRAMIATQSRLTAKSVLITNLVYNRIATDDPEYMYLVSLSYAFRNPKWSVFAENQGIKSDRYSDLLIRGGIAHLFGENFQADVNLGASLKDTPSRMFMALGCSYRLDFHQDKLIPIEDQKAGENGGPIKRNSMKKKGKMPGLSKKEERRRRKQAKKRKQVDDFQD